MKFTGVLDEWAGLNIEHNGIPQVMNNTPTINYGKIQVGNIKPFFVAKNKIKQILVETRPGDMVMLDPLGCSLSNIWTIF